jgi:cutinase
VKFNRIRTPRVGSVRSAARWVGLGASALVTAIGLLVNPSVLPLAHAFDCPDVEVIFARGTNEPAGLGKVGDAFVDSLRQQTGGLNILPYGVNYAASKLQLHGGDGANDTIDRVKKSVETCPNTKIVLGGYSQGASVMDIVAGVPIGGISWGSSLPPQYANNIVAVATFGDVADRSGGTLPSQSAMLGSKAIDLCNPNDPICHAGPGNEWSGHTEGYVPVYTTQAAAFVASKLVGTGQSVPGYGPSVPGAGPQTPGYGPQTPGLGPQTPGQAPGPGPLSPQAPGPLTPSYAPQTPTSSVPGPPAPQTDVVAAVH